MPHIAHLPCRCRRMILCWTVHLNMTCSMTKSKSSVVRVVIGNGMAFAPRLATVLPIDSLCRVSRERDYFHRMFYTEY